MSWVRLFRVPGLKRKNGTDTGSCRDVCLLHIFLFFFNLQEQWFFLFLFVQLFNSIASSCFFVMFWIDKLSLVRNPLQARLSRAFPVLFVSCNNIRDGNSDIPLMEKFAPYLEEILEHCSLLLKPSDREVSFPIKQICGLLGWVLSTYLANCYVVIWFVYQVFE